MISQLLEMKINEAYKALDEAYVQASKDSLVTFDKNTIQAAKKLDRCIVILDGVKK
jgi:hypothetical protein